MPKWRNEYRKCDNCRGECRPQREAQSYCSRGCRRAAAYGRERFQSQTKGPRKRLLKPRREASETSPPSPLTAPKTLSGRVVAGSFRKGGFSSTKTISCGRVVCGEFQWRGLAIQELVLTLIADADYSHLFRIRYPDGWTSTAAKLTRAKQAAYEHARFLLKEAA